MHGLAWANVLAAVMQTAYLAYRLEEIPIHIFFFNTPLQIPSVLLSAGFMSGILWFLNQSILDSLTKFGSMLHLLIAIPAGIFVFGASLFFLGFPDLRAVLKNFFSK